MKTKKQAPVYLVKNDYSRNINGRHPSVVVMVQEMDVPVDADGMKTYREVVSKEIHHNNGAEIYATKAAAIAHDPSVEA
jgi:hypothetical protein